MSRSNAHYQDDQQNVIFIDDISGGQERSAVKLVAASRFFQALESEFKYITDSIFPDGTSIADIVVASNQADDSATNEVSSDGSDEDDRSGDPRGCACLDIDGTHPSCGVDQSSTCDCVGSFGNFYKQPNASLSEQSRVVLLLNALPEKLPLVECGPECSCTPSTCANRVTQQSLSIELEIRSSPTGLGAFYPPKTSTALPKGTFIGLYAGEYLTTDEAKQRWSSGYKDNYILSLRLPDLTVHIDPRHKGNVGRFLNHSCDPNCVVLIVYWGQSSWPRAAIFTKRDIESGEELTFDYANPSGSRATERGASDSGSDESHQSGRTKCLCGSKNCRGWMPFDESI